MVKTANNPVLNRFLSQPLGLWALVVISIFTLVSLLGYLIIPDKTSDANQQFLKLRTAPIGYSYKLLPLKPFAHQTKIKQNFLEIAISGKELSYIPEPYTQLKVVNDSIVTSLTINGATTEETFSFAEIDSSFFIKSNIQQNEIIKKYPLGSDGYGRCLLSRLVIGGRVSLSVGFLSVFLSLTIGIFVGLFSGYYGGVTDKILSWIMSVFWAIPTLLWVIAISVALGKGFWQIFIAIGCTTWVDVARLVRGQVKSINSLEYIQACKALGYSDIRGMWYHILPNILGPILVLASANFATAILLESGLSFLGIGIQPPTPSWGNMLQENYGYLVGKAPQLALFPGLAIAVMVISFNFLGNALRDSFDVKIEVR